MEVKDASYLFDEPVPYSASKSIINMGAGNTTPRKPLLSGYNDTLAGRVNVLSANRKDDSDSGSIQQQLMMRGIRDSSIHEGSAR